MSFDDHKEFWQEFILLFKEKTCLWEVKSKGYHNKQLKQAAYECLVQKCKEIFPQANKEFVIKKISSLRASFRRQRKKIEDARRSGAGSEDLPEVTLWYYDLLEFLLDQDEQRVAVSTLESLNEGASVASESQLSDSLHHSVLSPESPHTSDHSSISHKRSAPKTPWTKKRDEFLEAGIRVLREDSGQHADCQEISFGSNVGQQLMQLEKRQKIFAQKLISDVLFHAQLGNLSDYSVVNIMSQPREYQLHIPSTPNRPLFVAHSSQPQFHIPSPQNQTQFLAHSSQQTPPNSTQFLVESSQASPNPSQFVASQQVPFLSPRPEDSQSNRTSSSNNSNEYPLLSECLKFNNNNN